MRQRETPASGCVFAGFAFGRSSCQPDATPPRLRTHSQAPRLLGARLHNPWAHNDVDLNQKREFSDGLFAQSHGSFELVLAPVLFALVGFGIDGLLGITPVLTITFTLLGMVGAFAKLVYAYRAAHGQSRARRVGAGLP